MGITMRIQNLSFSFNQANRASGCDTGVQDTYFFKNMSVSFVPSFVNFILGDNGVGKSTLFSILRGVHVPGSQLSGSVELDGVRYVAHDNQLPTAFTQHVHMVHQNYDGMLAAQCTGEENLQLAAMPRYPGLKCLGSPTLASHISQTEPKFYSGSPSSGAFFSASQVTERFGIDIRKPVYLLSGGQRQMLAILMALQKATKILLLDEPTATLDYQNARLIMDMLRELAAELAITILVICHDKKLVAQYAQPGACMLLTINQLGEREIVKQ